MSDIVKALDMDVVPPEEITGPIEVTIVDDDAAIENLVQEAMLNVGKALPHSANLVLGLTDDMLDTLGPKVIEIYEADERTRMDWKQTYQDSLRLLGLKEEVKTNPWPNACGVVHPMITEAVIRFQANTIMELFPLTGPFKAKVEGRTTEALTEIASRLQVEMNYIATKKMVEYRTEVEQGLWRLGLAGMSFRKVWWDPSRKRPKAETVPAEDIVVPFGSSHIYSAPRITHIIKMHREEVDRMIASGWWYEQELPDVMAEYSETEQKEGELLGTQATLEHDSRHIFYEMQIDLDLDGFQYQDENGAMTGLALPYVVTVERQSRKVMAVRRNWVEGDDTYTRCQNISAMCYIPGWGFYGIGLLTLLAGLATGATTILRQTVDAGTLANLPSAFKGKGFKTRNDSSPLRPGEIRDVEIYSGKIGDHIYQMKFGEPSTVLLGLMGNMVEEGRRLGAIAELPTKTGEMPVGTIIAMIEHQTKPQSAVHARVYASFAEELDMIVSVLKTNKHQYQAPSNQGFNFMEDIKAPINLCPVADPGAASSSVRILQSQAAVEMAGRNPEMYDQPYVHRAMLKVMGVGDVDAMIPNKDQIAPADILTENHNILTGKPVKAGIAQDHKAHLQGHMAMLQDPRIAAAIGQSPKASAIQAALADHMAEHAAFLHRDEVLKMLGATLPMGPLPPEIENRLAPLIAEAASRATAQGQAKAQQAQQEQQAQDPVVQMQAQDLGLRKEKQDGQFQLEVAKLQLEAKRIGGQLAIDGMKLDEARKRAGADLVQRILSKQGS